MVRCMAAWLLAAMVVFAAGCGKKSVEVVVSGKVTLDGTPVPQGSISFVSADGSTPPGGGVIRDGAYTARVPPGEKLVMVQGNKVIGKEPLYQGVPDSPTRDKLEMITAPAYNAAHLTPLKASVSAPRQDLDFQLTARPGPPAKR